MEVFLHFNENLFLFLRNRPSQSARSSVMYDPSFINDLNEEDDDNESNASLMHSSDESVDEFTKLKVEREKQRADRALGKIARSIENNRQSTLDLADGESLLLADLAETSKYAMQSGRYKKDDTSNK